MPRFFVAILLMLTLNVASANVLGSWVNAMDAATKHQAGTSLVAADKQAELIVSQCEEEEGEHLQFKATALPLILQQLFFAYSFSNDNISYPLADMCYEPAMASPPLHLRLGVFLI